MPADRRRAVLDEVRELLATDPDTAGADPIELPYRAHIYWIRPRAVQDGPSTGVVVAVNVSPGGVPKQPIAGRRIRRLGLDGDAHRLPPSVHGGPDQAVCLYAVEAIERVRADGHQAFPGAYGEEDARWYASVVEEGPVKPGDRVDLIRTV